MNMSHVNSITVLHDYSSKNDSTVDSFNDTLIAMEMRRFISNVNHWLLIFECLLVFCGLCGNSLALIVVNRRSLRDTSSSVFITYLAIFDSLVLIVNFVSLFSSKYIQHFLLHCSLTFLTDFVTFSSVWIMVIMTIERCIAVHSPFLAKRFCTVQRARYAIYLLIFWSFLFFFITFPFVHTIGRRYRQCYIAVQFQVVLRIVKPTIFYFIPDLILLINIFIIYEIFMARRQRSKSLMNPENAVHQIDAAAFNRKQQQLTIMLVTVSLSFYLFNTPAVIDYILQLHPPKDRDIKSIKMRFLRANVTVLWLQMSSATNFFFYCLAGSRFRTASFELFEDIYEYIRSQFDENYQRRRYLSTARSNSNVTLEMRQCLGANSRLHHRSASIPQTFTSPLTFSSKRASNETVASANYNSHRASKATINVLQDL